MTICGLVWSYCDLIDAIQSQMSEEVDRAKIALLNPKNQPYHLAYRRHFTLLSVGLIATLVWLRNAGARRNNRLEIRHCWD